MTHYPTPKLWQNYMWKLKKIKQTKQIFWNFAASVTLTRSLTLPTEVILTHNTWSAGDQTNFFAVKKLFMCKLCHVPTTISDATWITDHQNTRWLVLSLVYRKRSSRTWKWPHCLSLYTQIFNKVILVVIDFKWLTIKTTVKSH